MRTQTSELGGLKSGLEAFYGPELDSGLQVTVVYTTPEGTLEALKAAGALAQDLAARVALVVTEVVPFRLPLDQPRVSVEFLKRRQDALVSEANIEGEEVRVQIWLCRDQKQTLRQVLPPRSLVVIGGRRNWWSRRELRLETFLSRIGHHVIFIEGGATNSMAASPEREITQAFPLQASHQ
jgi:hypothetical protein